MKIAIFHNFMDNIGGAEFVTLHLARGLNADIYTTNLDLEKIKKMGFSDVCPRIKSIGKIPTQAPFRHQFALWKFRKLNLKNKYDFYIICGDWAMSGAVNNKPNLWYVHGPINELWEFKKYVKNNMLNWWQKPIFDVWVIFNRYLTKKYSKSVGKWVCNSKNVQARIKKYYKADAKVIHPPIDTSKYYCGEDKGYWLSVNRLLYNKRVDIQIEAFSEMPTKKLIIIGSYEKGATQFEKYKKYIDDIKTTNVEIKHWVSDEELKKLYAECTGFIATARNEDFGMTVTEAMAAGKPVIAANEGGFKESIVHNETGVLIDNINKDLLKTSIEKISKEIQNNPLKYHDACLERAKMFDVKNFIESIKMEIN